MRSIAARPDALVIIDSPDFTHRVARRVRKAAPDIPIINYAPPRSGPGGRAARARCAPMWTRCWRSCRSSRRRSRASTARPAAMWAIRSPSGSASCGRTPRRRGAGLPIRRWCWCCRAAGAARSALRRDLRGRDRAGGGQRAGPFELVLPTLPHVARARPQKRPPTGRCARASWSSAAEKYAAFRSARAALAKSGTVTLELALAQVPTVAAYRIAAWEAPIYRRLVRVSSVILANLVIGENVVPELLQEEFTPELIAEKPHPVDRRYAGAAPPARRASRGSTPSWRSAASRRARRRRAQCSTWSSAGNGRNRSAANRQRCRRLARAAILPSRAGLRPEFAET